MTPEEDQSMVESAWEKTWDNFSTNMTQKYGKKNLRNYNKKYK